MHKKMYHSLAFLLVLSAILTGCGNAGAGGGGGSNGGGNGAGNSADPYDLTAASASGVELYVGDKEVAPAGMAFNNDGTKLFVIGFSSDNVVEYRLTTGYDLSTASASGDELSVFAGDRAPHGIAFNDDGTKLFIIGNSEDVVVEYSLTTGYDLTTASGPGDELDVAGELTRQYGMAFNGDGTKLFVIGSLADKVVEYTLTTGYDLTTASASGDELSVATEESLPEGMAFNGDGTKLFVIGSDDAAVVEYTLTIGYDLTTASASGVELSVASEETNPTGMAFNDDGTKLFVIGAGDDAVVEYLIGSD
jgi:DNA-binding beta-propeller fold protein YncE